MEKLDKARYLRRVILVCWISLLSCFAFKILGSDAFRIAVQSERFAMICNYLDTYVWTRWLIGFAYSMVSTYYYILAMIGKTRYTKVQFSVLTISVAVSTLIKIFDQNLGLVMDIWVAVVMPCVFSLDCKKRHWNVLIGNILVFVFQAISLFVKSLSFGFVVEGGALVSCIYSLDVIMMVILYFLYSGMVNIDKEGRSMSYFFIWLQGKGIDKLKKAYEKRIQKKAKIDAELSAIKERIDELESKN